MFADSNGGNGMYMPVAPAFSGYGGGFGGGMGFGGDWAWILLLLVLGGGWGNGFGMGGMGGLGGLMGFGIDFPWLLNGQNQINANTNAGFDHAATQSALGNLSTAVTSGFGDVQLGIAGVNQNICQTGNGIQNALCQGFAGTTAAVNAAQNALSQQMNTNEVANLNRSFAEQVANMQGFNSVNASLADVKYTEATEACATRTAAATNTRDIIDSQTRGTQAILDKLCQLELDGVKNQVLAEQRENANLRTQLSAAQFAASQAAQTATFQQGLNNEVDALYNRLKNCPVGTVPVYGNTPIFTCPQTAGCGCGGNGFMN